MSRVEWRQVRDDDFALPPDVPLDDLTAELTAMLGDPDPGVRDGLAYLTMATWVERGVYDDLLPGLGDGMLAGLQVGLGDVEGDAVFRRSFSALILAECLARDTARPLVPPGQVLRWGDAVATWLLRERDVRGFVPGKGWAHAVAHGADALGALAGSRHLGPAELVVVLDVVADRVLLPVDRLLAHGEDDRLAGASLEVLRRDLTPLSVLEPWVARLAASASAVRPPATGGDDDPFLATGHAQAFLRSLHLRLLLGPRPPAVRADLLLVLTDVLRQTNPGML